MCTESLLTNVFHVDLYSTNYSNYLIVLKQKVRNHQLNQTYLVLMR